MKQLEKRAGLEATVPYFYRVHDLEYIVPLLAAAAKDKSGAVAGALFSDLARNWNVLERFTEAELALVSVGKVPNMRAIPKAQDDELVAAGNDLWIERLRERDWCPTTFGPRRSSHAWLRTAEVERRFGRQVSDAGRLLPILDVQPELVAGRTQALLQLLGVRTELTASSFTAEDGRVLLQRIEELYGPAAEEGTLSETTLRQVIRPAHRNLVELLPGAELPAGFAKGVLADAPLLVHDGDQNYRFEPGSRVFYIDRASTRDRLGSPKGLWSVVLEATPAARAPLIALCGVRILEEAVVWSPSAGDAPFDDEGIQVFRAGLRELAPFVLSRLSVERQEDRQVSQDRRRLKEFVEVVKPVRELSVTCRLDGQEMGSTVARSSFVNVPPRDQLTAFVRWSEKPWPPTPEDAEALATALADLVDSSHLEAFLALVGAGSAEARSKLLRLAGAATDVALLWDEVDTKPSHDSGQTEDEPEKTAGEVADETAPTPRSHESIGHESAKTPLYSPAQLLIDGVPVLVSGAPRPEHTPPQRAGGSGGSSTNDTGYGGKTRSRRAQRARHVCCSHVRTQPAAQGRAE